MKSYPESITTAELHAFSDEELKHLESATSRLANETQRQAAHYQREAAKMRGEQQRRKRNANSH